MNAPSFEITQTIRLPAGVDDSPLSASSVVTSETGQVFVADEFGHRILGYDARGNLLWICGSTGFDELRFRYPCGIALGWIRKDGERRHCLAVADSWNRQVSFLDLSGNPLHVWRAYGEMPLGQIIDLRYARPDPGEAEGTWILLDRTEHRLLGLTESGAPLFHAGRPLPQGIGAGWPISSFRMIQDVHRAGALPAFPPRDFLYYPYRLLGKEPESLLIWEPASRTLKAALFGSFLPITQVLPEDLEWIAADSRLLLGWDPARDVIRCFEADGTALGPWNCDGRPVPSNLSPSECWIQAGGELRRVRLLLEENRSAKQWPLAPGLLAVSATGRSMGVDPAAAKESTANLVRLLDELVSAAESLTNTLMAATPVDPVNDFNLKMETLNAEMVRSEGRLQDDLWPPLNAVVDWHFASAACGGRLQPLSINPEQFLRSVCEPLYAGFERWVQTYDTLRVTRARLPPAPPGRQNVSQGTSESALAVIAVLGGVIQWLFSRLGPAGCGVREPLKWPGGRNRLLVEEESHDFRAPAVTTGYSGVPLREVRRIRVTCASGISPARPNFLCRGPENQFLVSLSNGNEVQCLDEHGKTTMSLKEAGCDEGQFLNPSGILLDGQGRLWISNVGKGSVMILSPPFGTGSTQIVHGISDCPMAAPSGLFQVSTGEVLVAEAFRNRILRIGTDGKASVWLNPPGAGSGELLTPVSFTAIPEDPRGAFWLVGRGNHRLQVYDEEGRAYGGVGGCGLDDGCLLWPRSAAYLADGTLVVAEERFPGCLVFMTASGSVSARMPLDYIPGHLMRVGDRLYITDVMGDTIRIYATP